MPAGFHLYIRVLTVALLTAGVLRAEAQQDQTRGRVSELFQKAQQAERSEDYAAAAEYYRAVTALDPQIAEVWSNLGMALYRQGKNHDAVGAFQRAVSLKPALLAPHLFAGKAYLDMVDAPKALPPLKDALALAPNEPQTLLALSDAYALNRQYPLAVETLHKALRLEPGSEDASSRLAVTYLEWAANLGVNLRRSPSPYGRLLHAEGQAVEHPESADEEFQKAVSSFPGNTELRLAYAEFLLANQPTPAKLQAGQEQIDLFRTMAPNLSDGAAMSIRLAIAKNSLPDAIAELHTLAAHDPEFLLANLEKLTERLSTSDAHDAAENAKTLALRASLQPGSYSSEWNTLVGIRAHRRLAGDEAIRYASAAWHLRKYAEGFVELMAQTHLTGEGNYWLFRICAELGKEMLQATVDAHPDSLRSHLLLGDLALQQDRIAKARAEYDAALALRPHDPGVQLVHVRFLETARDTERAVAEAKAYANEFPQNADLNFEAGDLLVHTGGDSASATHYLERAVNANPKSIKPRLDLADALAQSLRFDEAIAEVNKIIDADKDGSMHYRVGLWCRQTGRSSEAGEAFERAKLLKQTALKSEQRPPPENAER